MQMPRSFRRGPRSPGRAAASIAVALLALTTSAELPAQQEAEPATDAPRPPATADLEGTVRSTASTSGEGAATPLAGAEVWILGTGIGTLTDDRGWFRMTGLPPGRYRLLVGALDHREAVASVDLVSGGTERVEIALETVGADLERRSVALLGEAGGTRGRSGRAGFHRRMEGGLGQYVTRVEIDVADASRLSQVIREYTSVEVRPCTGGESGGGGSCYWVVTGTRLRIGGGVGGSDPSLPGSGGFVAGLRAGGAPGGDAGKPCLADVYLDGAPLNQEAHPNGIDAVLPSQVEAIEVYKRGALAPARFRTLGGCGVVLLWSRGTDQAAAD